MGKYRLKSGTHYEAGKRLEVGAIVEMTPERYASLRDRFELVESVEPEPLPKAPPPPEVAEPELPPDLPVPPSNAKPAGLDAMHWRAAVSLVEQTENVEALEALRSEETEGRNRSTVLSALDKKLGEE